MIFEINIFVLLHIAQIFKIEFKKIRLLSYIGKILSLLFLIKFFIDDFISSFNIQKIDF